MDGHSEIITRGAQSIHGFVTGSESESAAFLYLLSNLLEASQNVGDSKEGGWYLFEDTLKKYTILFKEEKFKLV